MALVPVDIVTVPLFAVQPWPEISAPVDCRVVVEYTDADHWQASHVEFPELVTRDGPFRLHPRWVRLISWHPLSEVVKAYCNTEDGAKVIRDAVRDAIDAKPIDISHAILTPREMIL